MESDTAWAFHTEHAAVAFNYIYCQLCVFPVFVLLMVHVKLNAFYFSSLDIRRTNYNHILFQTHRTGTVTASSGLVEDEFTVFFLQLFDQIFGRLSGIDRFVICHHLEKSFSCLTIADQQVFRLLVMT